MNIKRNIIFSLESRKKNGIVVVNNIPIRMRVIYASNRIDFSTGYRIDVAKWDTEKQRVKNGCTNKLKQTASEINADLLKYYTIIQNIFKEFEVQDIIPTAAQIKSAFSEKNKKKEFAEFEENKPVKLSLSTVFDKFIAECSVQNNWTNSTIRRFLVFKNHLLGFDKNITFESIDETSLTNLVNYLQNDKNLQNSTIEKEIKLFKWFLRWSFKKGYNKNNSYDTFNPKIKTATKKIIFLTWGELNQMRNYLIPQHKQYLERVRDVFLFCCFNEMNILDWFLHKKYNEKSYKSKAPLV